MLVRFGCWLVLLAFVYVALADLEVSKDFAEEIEYDNNTFVDKVSFKPKQCQSDEDCRNDGKCEADEKSAKFCTCRNGTRGDFCDIVDECINGSVDCGVKKDVSCVFDVQLEKNVCKCDNKSKAYVPDEGCTSLCGYFNKRDVYVRCGDHGYCSRKIGKNRFCKCQAGAAGDFCEIIEECQNKVVDCGTDPLAVCDLSRDGHAYCKCSNPELGFDYDHKICKECTGCDAKQGSKNTGCVYENGTRTCNCKRKFYSSNEGICEDCKCGPDGVDCTFRNGTKTCSCYSGAKPNGDVCEKCECGTYDAVAECEFKEGKKVCTCNDGYIPVGPDKICTQKCNDTNPCQNGGTCSQNVCSCLNGTSGHLCKTIDDCRSRCGRADCFYNVTSRDIYCKCDKGYAFDDYNKMCRACDCGSYSKSCSYVEGQKKCTCFNDVYADRLGECTLCYCKGYASMSGCKFGTYGQKICKCLRGYAQLDEECKKCDCGIHGNCTLYGWGSGSKSCKCEKGYAEKYGKCEECDCGKNGTCGFISGIKVCYCEDGFRDNHQGTCEECDCGDFSRCKFDSNGYKVCTCIDGYALKSGVCTPCHCDPGTSCIFKNLFPFEKECICPDHYANSFGTCIECDCKKEGSNCTMDTGLRKCQCPNGFESSKDPFVLNPTCTDINECLRPQDNDCPFGTECVNTWGSYECDCKEGFEAINKYGSKNTKRDGCKDIDECLDYSACISSHTRCVNTPGSYRCECKAGYSVEKDSYKEKYNFCSEDSRPWRTASIVIGCLFGFVILGLLVGICNKHCA